MGKSADAIALRGEDRLGLSRDPRYDGSGKVTRRAFHGVVPGLSLMTGCSPGGYQELVEAQCFPWDFGGIVAVAPDIDEAALAMQTAFAARNLAGDDGHPIFAAGDLAIPHQAALDACDLEREWDLGIRRGGHARSAILLTYQARHCDAPLAIVSGKA